MSQTPRDSAVLRSYRFREEREGEWKRLEEILRRAESGGPHRLTPAEMVELPRLYRAAVSSLSVARAISLDRSLVAYLDALCARAYFFVYGNRSTLGDRLSSYFLHDWPGAVRRSWREVSFAAFCLFGGWIVAFILFFQDPETFYLFHGGGFDMRTPSAPTEYLRSTLYNSGGTDIETMLGAFASQLFSHNAGIAILAFALGFGFGIPTSVLLVYNGLHIGAFYALFWSRGLGLEVTGWLFIHGVTELTAIILAGAAGLVIGRAVAFPGPYTRLRAAQLSGERAGRLILGAITMLFIAALLEGFGRESINSDAVRFVIAGGTLLLWALYFFAPRRLAKART